MFSTAETIYSAVGVESSEEVSAIEFGTNGGQCSCHSSQTSGAPGDPYLIRRALTIKCEL